MRRKVIFVTLAVAMFLSHPAAAEDYTQVIVSELQAEGYTDIQTKTTLLGRVRIVAQLKGGSREIILNPRTGEILRDLWWVADGDASIEGSRLIGNDRDDDSNEDSLGPGSDQDDNGADDSSESDSTDD